ncbi:protein NIM1-INTERACTING 1-like [Quillaja saponaria]|uniref:Protein NIM1-INTERACTING 1-like n=1 Tax=Quillaja saponaria TaxID=32244 RepID=A0AAD7Q1R2_QUISA|nr:protein NIM1-INTERACTING 1-like [Quillaja saponaria]
MEEARKKRKLENDKEDEEEKMEEFFSLIRSTKDRLRIGSNGSKEKDKKAAGIWNPRFKPEDFMEDHEKLCKSDDGSTQAEPSNKEVKEMATAEAKKEDEEKEGNDLDLKLSL